jgi:hypothetical protein
MASHQELLSRFFDAHSVSQHGDVASRLTGTRLLALAQRLQPGRPARSDRPGAPLAPRSSAATRRKAATPSGSGASAQAKPKGSAKAPGNAAHKASPVPRSPRKKPSRPRD